MQPRSTRTARRVEVLDDGARRARKEHLAVEQPLEVRLRCGAASLTLGVVLRTPGDDFELVAGLLHAERVVGAAGELRQMAYCDDVADQQFNVVTAEVGEAAFSAAGALGRRTVATTACGACGTPTLDALAARDVEVRGDVVVDASVLASLPERMRSAQPLFDATGGTHAAALFTPGGELLALREDVGRHNAVDKVVGWALLSQRLPLDRHVLAVSGRAAYEIVQKAAAAGVPVVAAVSAPSSLAVEAADRLGVTLAGFVRGARATLYSHPQRVR